MLLWFHDIEHSWSPFRVQLKRSRVSGWEELWLKCNDASRDLPNLYIQYRLKICSLPQVFGSKCFHENLEETLLYKLHKKNFI